MQSNVVLRLYVSPPIQEEGEDGKVAMTGSLMEGGTSILQHIYLILDDVNIFDVMCLYLTLFFASISAPLSRRRATSSCRPLPAAL